MTKCYLIQLSANFPWSTTKGTKMSVNWRNQKRSKRRDKGKMGLRRTSSSKENKELGAELLIGKAVSSLVGPNLQSHHLLKQAF